jgi:glycosyltransferase involved in cell wall biosynthesis
MNKVLIITYYWPPSGGAGVQRWLKFSKYLPEFGWEPIILTVDPDYATYPVIDSSLKNDIPVNLRVYSTRAIDYFSIYKNDKSKIPTAGFANSVENTLKGKILRFIRGNFFIPDPRKGWNKFAFQKACDLIEAEGLKHVITTSPPHSTQLIGLKLKKKYPGIKWIADLRDPWTDIYYYKHFYPTFFSKRIDLLFENSVLLKADRIIAVGPSLKKSFTLKAKGIENKIEVVTNGFDENDFLPYSGSSPQIFTISYIGTLSEDYPIQGFLNALKDFRENIKEFKLRFIGTVSARQKIAIQSSPGCQTTEFINNVAHSEAISYMRGSSLLLLIIPDHSDNKSIITGKIFEYLASGKPVICIGPTDGDAAEILRETGSGSTFSYKDSKGILDYLMTSYTGNINIEKGSANVFSRRELTRKIISLLEEK